MQKRSRLIAMLSLLPSLCFASGMSPVCKFSTSKNGSVIDGKYRIADAYQAADLVVVGTAMEKAENGKPQAFEVKRIVKGGKQESRRIKLVGPHCQGTACDGLSLPPKKEFLLLLRIVPGGMFQKVDGNGNDVCPNIFEAEDGYAKIGAKNVPVDSLKSFLESRPEPISYE